mmetsp:Transcript_35105/g.74683  ORF Transcript_35105/g.74683 Transcript_35105/m.74683 type:complete len:249 (-) Transcript_35105:1600-2346(-)
MGGQVQHCWGASSFCGWGQCPLEGRHRQCAGRERDRGLSVAGTAQSMHHPVGQGIALLQRGSRFVVSLQQSRPLLVEGQWDHRNRSLLRVYMAKWRGEQHLEPSTIVPSLSACCAPHSKDLCCGFDFCCWWWPTTRGLTLESLHEVVLILLLLWLCLQMDRHLAARCRCLKAAAESQQTIVLWLHFRLCLRSAHSITSILPQPARNRIVGRNGWSAKESRRHSGPGWQDRSYIVRRYQFVRLGGILGS